eukprot:gene9363-6583_t
MGEKTTTKQIGVKRMGNEMDEGTKEGRNIHPQTTNERTGHSLFFLFRFLFPFWFYGFFFIISDVEAPSYRPPQLEERVYLNVSIIIIIIIIIYTFFIHISVPGAKWVTGIQSEAKEKAALIFMYYILTTPSPPTPPPLSGDTPMTGNIDTPTLDFSNDFIGPAVYIWEFLSRLVGDWPTGRGVRARSISQTLLAPPPPPDAPLLRPGAPGEGGAGVDPMKRMHRRDTIFEEEKNNPLPSREKGKKKFNTNIKKPSVPQLLTILLKESGGAGQLQPGDKEREREITLSLSPTIISPCRICFFFFLGIFDSYYEKQQQQRINASLYQRSSSQSSSPSFSSPSLHYLPMESSTTGAGGPPPPAGTPSASVGSFYDSTAIAHHHRRHRHHGQDGAGSHSSALSASPEYIQVTLHGMLYRIPMSFLINDHPGGAYSMLQYDKKDISHFFGGHSENAHRRMNTWLRGPATVIPAAGTQEGAVVATIAPPWTVPAGVGPSPVTEGTAAAQTEGGVLGRLLTRVGLCPAAPPVPYGPAPSPSLLEPQNFGVASSGPSGGLEPAVLLDWRENQDLIAACVDPPASSGGVKDVLVFSATMSAVLGAVMVGVAFAGRTACVITNNMKHTTTHTQTTTTFAFIASTGLGGGWGKEMREGHRKRERERALSLAPTSAFSSTLPIVLLSFVLLKAMLWCTTVTSPPIQPHTTFDSPSFHPPTPRVGQKGVMESQSRLPMHCPFPVFAISCSRDAALPPPNTTTHSYHINPTTTKKTSYVRLSNECSFLCGSAPFTLSRLPLHLYDRPRHNAAPFYPILRASLFLVATAASFSFP